MACCLYNLMVVVPPEDMEKVEMSELPGFLPLQPELLWLHQLSDQSMGVGRGLKGELPDLLPLSPASWWLHGLSEQCTGRRLSTENLPGLNVHGSPIMSSKWLMRRLSQESCLARNPCIQAAGSRWYPVLNPRIAPPTQQLLLLSPPSMANCIMKSLPHTDRQLSYTDSSTHTAVMLLSVCGQLYQSGNPCHSHR